MSRSLSCFTTSKADAANATPNSSSEVPKVPEVAAEPGPATRGASVRLQTSDGCQRAIDLQINLLTDEFDMPIGIGEMKTTLVITSK